jgi:hypothetical protein
VQENSKRGVPRELIEKQKDQIYSRRGAQREGAREAGVFGPAHRGAGKNPVTQEEVLQRAQSLAAMYQIPPDKFIKDLQKRNGMNELYDQIAHEKVLEFLEINAKIENVPAAISKINPSAKRRKAFVWRGFFQSVRRLN